MRAFFDRIVGEAAEVSDTKSHLRLAEHRCAVEAIVRDPDVGPMVSTEPKIVEH